MNSIEKDQNNLPKNLKECCRSYLIQIAQTFEAVKPFFEKNQPMLSKYETAFRRSNKQAANTIKEIMEELEEAETETRVITEAETKLETKYLRKKYDEREFKEGITYTVIALGIMGGKTRRKLVLKQEDGELLDLYSKGGMLWTQAKNLRKMTIVYMFCLLEACFKKLLFHVYVLKPICLKSKEKKIDYETLLSHSSLVDLYYFLAIEETNKIGYMDIDKIANYFIKKLGFDFTKYEKWEQLRESYYRRNIIVHNGGKISSIYLRKLNLDKNLLNTELELDFNYVKSFYENIHGMVSYLKDNFPKKFL